MPDPEPVIEGKPTAVDISVLLGLYDAERSNSASLMQAGRSIFQTLLAYVGAVIAFGYNLHKALFILIVPAPALGLLIVFTVNSFNLSLRDVSGRTLEKLLLRATSDYLPNWTIDSLQGLRDGDPEVEKELKALHPKRFPESATPLPVREIAIGLGATEHFYNRRRANPSQLWFLRIYTAQTAFFVLTGMALVFCYGLYLAFHEQQAAKWTWPGWSLMWLEIAVFIALVAIFIWTLFSGSKHRRRAEIAASIVLGDLPALSRADPRTKTVRSRTAPKDEPSSAQGEPAVRGEMSGPGDANSYLDDD